MLSPEEHERLLPILRSQGEAAGLDYLGFDEYPRNSGKLAALFIDAQKTDNKVIRVVRIVEPKNAKKMVAQ